MLTGQKYGSDTNTIPTDPAVLYATAKVPWWVSLTRGRHKYIRTLVAGEVEELNDLRNDPEELVNLALDTKYLKRLRAMRAATIAELRRTDAGLVDALPVFSTPE